MTLLLFASGLAVVYIAAGLLGGAGRGAGLGELDYVLSMVGLLAALLVSCSFLFALGGSVFRRRISAVRALGAGISVAVLSMLMGAAGSLVPSAHAGPLSWVIAILVLSFLASLLGASQSNYAFKPTAGETALSSEPPGPAAA